MRIVIVGGGVAGLAIGWRLAASGASVDVLERGIAGRASTWAAAGMLAPAAEAGHQNDAHARLCRDARVHWPEFVKALEEASGIAVGFSECGSLTVAQSDSRAQELLERAGAVRANGLRGEWIDAGAARAIEPALAPDSRGALYAPDDAKVDNRALPEALTAALRRAGGRLREACAVQSVQVESGRVTAVTTSAETFAADSVIVAAGAWSSLLKGVAENIFPPVHPAKGQMALLRVPAGAAMPRRLVWGEGIYIVPGREGVLLGATVEDQGYDTSVTREARDMLFANAARTLPVLSGWTVSESWAGLRPRTPDGNPALGETAITGLYMATGQFRNGILFAPVVAEILCDLVLGKNGNANSVAFDPRRFAMS